ncbi:MAG: hypothetical protein J6U99_00640, partial [Rikenellaceae bacterium]|nr:hypothetical protein [Rikenellaceae bacterium]
TEFPAIMKGDSTQVKWSFDNQIVAHLEVEGIGETTPEDIKKGEFIVKVAPEQTTLYRVNVHTKEPDGTVKINYGLGNHRVIVVPDRKTLADVYMKVWLIDYEQDEIKRRTALTRYLNSISDGIPGKITYLEPYGNQTIKKVFDTKARLQMETERFDRIKWSPDIENLHSAIEHQVIARGDSTRIKFLFNNRRVRSIKVLGYGKASKEDIKKGEYIVTVAPKKTKLIECYINGGERAHRRVIVIDPEKYDEVMKEWGRYGYTLRYLDKLAGGVPLF